MLLPTISAGRRARRRVTAAALLVTAVGSWAVIGPAVADTKQGHASPSSRTLSPSAPDRSARCVGAWRVSITEGPETLRALVTFSADRTLAFGETSAVDSLTPGVSVEFPSPGAGAWKSHRNGSCSYHLVVLAANADGALTRTSDIRGAIHVTKDTFTGPLTIAVSHPTGPGAIITTTASGVRIAA